jgi:hypothetical protein
MSKTMIETVGGRHAGDLFYFLKIFARMAASYRMTSRLKSSNLP